MKGTLSISGADLYSTALIQAAARLSCAVSMQAALPPEVMLAHFPSAVIHNEGEASPSAGCLVPASGENLPMGHLSLSSTAGKRNEQVKTHSSPK